ncbi:MAG: disulfide bond formation protein B, partial [Candidatus Moraniibacteriota bacterium]
MLTNFIAQYSSRRWFFVIFLFCAFLLSFGYYLQLVVGLNPCPLCIFQRLFFFLVGVTALAGSLVPSRRDITKIGSFFTGLFSLVGGSIATWHIYIQYIPHEKLPDCG